MYTFIDKIKYTFCKSNSEHSSSTREFQVQHENFQIQLGFFFTFAHIQVQHIIFKFNLKLFTLLIFSQRRLKFTVDSVNAVKVWNPRQTRRQSSQLRLWLVECVLKTTIFAFVELDFPLFNLNFLLLRYVELEILPVEFECLFTYTLLNLKCRWSNLNRRTLNLNYKRCSINHLFN